MSSEPREINDGTIGEFGAPARRLLFGFGATRGCDDGLFFSFPLVAIYYPWYGRLRVSNKSRLKEILSSIFMVNRYGLSAS
jgi:hypothetical protein